MNAIMSSLGFAAACLSLALALASGCGDARSSSDATIDRVFGEVPYGTLDRAEAQRLLETPPESDGPFYLVTYVHHRAQAAYADGRPSSLTGTEANDRFATLMRPILSAIGAQPIYLADVEQSLIDHHGADWSRVAVVLFPSRAKFLEMMERADFRAAEVHQVAGVERMLALVTEILPLSIPDELRHVDLAKLPYPPTPTDPPVTVVHLLDFNDIARYPDGRPTALTGRQALELYEQARAPQALPLGVRPGIHLAVEGELIGDGRPWEEFRINNFPSRAAFAKLTTADSLDQAGYENREAALADTYALLAAPIVNRVGYGN